MWIGQWAGAVSPLSFPIWLRARAGVLRVCGLQILAFVCVVPAKGTRWLRRSGFLSGWPSGAISEESNYLPTDIKSWLLAVHMGNDGNETLAVSATDRIKS